MSSERSTKAARVVLLFALVLSGAGLYQNCGVLPGGGFQPTFDPPSTLASNQVTDAAAATPSTENSREPASPSATPSPMLTPTPRPATDPGNPAPTPTPAPTPAPTPTPASAPLGGQPRLILNDRQNVSIPGCNAPTWKQIPNMPDYFVGRIRRDSTTADPNACVGGEVYTLAWAKMNWATNKLDLIGKIVDLNAVRLTIQGKYTITTAYDPSIMWDGQDYWMAFECYGDGFTGTAAACMMPVRFAAPGGLDPSRGYVVISGNSYDPASPTVTSGSVPKLFRDDDGRVYLYYSAVKMPRNSVGITDWIAITVRGVELVKNAVGQWAPKGLGIEMPADHPSVTEVFGLEDKPGMRKTADGYQVAKVNGKYLLMGASGDCFFPDDAQAGCYRLTIRRSSVPLGNRIFNGERAPEHVLPSNSTQYFHLVQRPDGVARMIGLFAQSFAATNKQTPGFVSMGLASDAILFNSALPMENDPAAATVALAYRAVLKREPDLAGLRVNVGASYNGFSDAELLRSFAASPEAAQVYQTSAAPKDFVVGAWQKVLGHAVDAKSADFWISRLQSGASRPVDVLNALHESAEFKLTNPNLTPLY